MNRTWLKIQSRLHSLVYQKSGGRMGRYFGALTLLLTTIGRKSGKARTTPLFYITENQDWVIAGTNAGSDHHPAWWFNLQENPSARVQVNDQTYAVSILVATGEDRDTLWQSLLDIFSGYADYQKMTEREFPVVRLVLQSEE